MSDKRRSFTQADIKTLKFALHLAIKYEEGFVDSWDNKSEPSVLKAEKNIRKFESILRKTNELFSNSEAK